MAENNLMVVNRAKNKPRWYRRILAKVKKFFTIRSDVVGAEEEVTAIAPPRTLSAKEFVIIQAAPIPVFEKILGYLSPGYTWNFGRRVCKSWKQAIELFIVRSVFSKGLIQILMWSFKNYDEWLEDVNYRTHNAIYRCSDFDSKRNTFIFTAFKKWESYSISGPLPDSTANNHRSPNWLVLDVISSIFPNRWVDTKYYKEPNQFHLYETATIILHSPECGREPMMTQDEIDEFNAKTCNLFESTTPREIPFTDWRFSMLCFTAPEVFIDLRFGKYLFKCRYITKLIHWTHNIVHTGRNWRQEWTLIIDRVEVKFTDFLTWRCGCEKFGNKFGDKLPCHMDTLLLSGYRLTFPTRGCIYAIDFPKYRQAFQYLPCADRDKWTNKLASLDEPAVAAFIPAELEKKPKPRHPPTPHVPCTECISGNAEGRFAQDGMNVDVKSASARCVNKLCARCCTSALCKGHSKCLECREGKYKGSVAEHNRVRIFGRTCRNCRRGYGTGD
jgi:hypothetical protein